MNSLPIQEANLKLVYTIGYDEEGVAIEKEVPYKYIKADATAAQLQAAVQAIGSLMVVPLSSAYVTATKPLTV